MLIALTVVGLLAAITVPRVRGYAEASRDVNLRQTASGIANAAVSIGRLTVDRLDPVSPDGTHHLR